MMNPFEALERRKGYSLRSQASWREQERLEEEVSRCSILIKICEENIAKHQRAVDDLTAQAVRSTSLDPSLLSDRLRYLEDENRQLPVFKKQLASLQSKIDALAKPTSSKAAERRNGQVHLGRLASQRLDQDRTIGRMVTKLRRLLEQRQALSAEMREIASAIDLRLHPDCLDEERFSVMLASLPEDTASKSEQWAAWFAGEEGGKKTYPVHWPFELKETLANCHYYRDGDKAQLTEAQVANLGRGPAGITLFGKARGRVKG